MSVLLADRTGNEVVNSSDVAQAKNQSGFNIDADNFRQDVTGVTVRSTVPDISVVNSRSGNAIPGSHVLQRGRG